MQIIKRKLNFMLIYFLTNKTVKTDKKPEQNFYKV